MSRGSIAERVVRGTMLASALSAIGLAAVAAFVAFLIWQGREVAALHSTTVALVKAIEAEEADGRSSLERAALEAVRESATGAYRIEVWQAGTLLVTNLAGPAVGPGPRNGVATDQGGWVTETTDLGSGLTLMVATRAQGREALEVFAWSIALSAPVCLGLALVIGRMVGRRATKPLAQFRERIAGAQPFQALRPPTFVEAPSEVLDLESSFRILWSRLSDALARETEFAANASHELRTPLTRIRLRAERALANSGPQVGRELSEQLIEIDRTVRLVDSLLVLSRDVSAGISGTEVVNLADIARGVAARLLPGQPAPYADLPDEALVHGDEDLLTIAVENLVDNARKFSSPSEEVPLKVSETSGRVRLVVVSPGARIQSEDGQRVFERFYRSAQARASREGHGLGLPLSRHIARLHGGDVRCLSGMNEDACFELDLPAWSPATDPPRGQEP